LDINKTMGNKSCSSGKTNLLNIDGSWCHESFTNGSCFAIISWELITQREPTFVQYSRNKNLLSYH
jgi:hypothetical protein